jgi:hypothetical protein
MVQIFVASPDEVLVVVSINYYVMLMPLWSCLHLF